MALHARIVIMLGGNAPINVLPQVYTTPRARVGDLTYVKSIASPLERMLGSNAPIKTVYFPLLSVNIDQIPLIWGMFIGQIQSNPHLLPVGW